MNEDGWCHASSELGLHSLAAGVIEVMATSEYRVIESADGTFSVQLWETTKRGNLLFTRDGFRTRQAAQDWITPVDIIDPSPITSTATGTRRPVWFVNVETGG